MTSYSHKELQGTSSSSSDPLPKLKMVWNRDDAGLTTFRHLLFHAPEVRSLQSWRLLAKIRRDAFSWRRCCNPYTKEALQRLFNCQRFSLTISLKKQTLWAGTCAADLAFPLITIFWKWWVRSLTCAPPSQAAELNKRIGKAALDTTRQEKQVWDSAILTTHSKNSSTVLVPCITGHSCTVQCMSGHSCTAVKLGLPTRTSTNQHVPHLLP